jgi:hypothetical protein
MLALEGLHRMLVRSLQRITRLYPGLLIIGKFFRMGIGFHVKLCIDIILTRVCGHGIEIRIKCVLLQVIDLSHLLDKCPIQIGICRIKRQHTAFRVIKRSRPCFPIDHIHMILLLNLQCLLPHRVCL